MKVVIFLKSFSSQDTFISAPQKQYWWLVFTSGKCVSHPGICSALSLAAFTFSTGHTWRVCLFKTAIAPRKCGSTGSSEARGGNRDAQNQPKKGRYSEAREGRHNRCGRVAARAPSYVPPQSTVPVRAPVPRVRVFAHPFRTEPETHSFHEYISIHFLWCESLCRK